jgi:anti-sigma factor RsiW
MTMTPDNELLAYLDGELDLENTLRVERRIAESAADADLLADFKFARRAVRDHTTRSRPHRQFDRPSINGLISEVARQAAPKQR